MKHLSELKVHKEARQPMAFLVQVTRLSFLCVDYFLNLKMDLEHPWESMRAFFRAVFGSLFDEVAFGQRSEEWEE